MDLSLTQFAKVARSNWFNNDIVLSKDGQSITSKFFHTKSSKPAAQVTNTATMNAFRTALQAEFGFTGLDAFDKLQEKRGGRSLRKSDVLDTIKLAKSMRDESFKGITTMNAFHEELRSVFGRYGQEAFQEMRRTNLDNVLNDSIIKNTIRVAQEKKTIAGNELRSMANKSLDQIFADQQRPYHKLPSGLRQQLRSAVMTKIEDMLQLDDVRQLILRHIREDEVNEHKDPQFPGGMDFHTSHAIQDAAKALGRPDIVKDDPIFNTEKKYNPHFNPMHAQPEAIGEGWVNVSVNKTGEVRDVDLIP